MAYAMSSFTVASTPDFYFANSAIGDMIIRTPNRVHIGSSNGLEAALAVSADEVKIASRLVIGSAVIRTSNTWVGINLDGEPTATLDVNGNIHCSGTINIGTTLQIQDSNAGASDSMYVGGDATIAGDFHIGGNTSNIGLAFFMSNVYVDDDLEVANNATVALDLTVLGKSSVRGAATFLSNVTVHSTLDVSDDAMFMGDATVLGGFSNTGGAFFSSNVAVQGTLSVAGDTGMAGDLAVAGLVTLSNDLLMKGGWIGIGVDVPSFPIHISDSMSNVSLFSSGKILAKEFTVYSDRRTKQNVAYRSAAEYLEMLPNIRPCDYDYIDHTDHGSRRRIGFIAQDVEAVVPCAVDTCSGFIPDIMSTAAVLERSAIGNRAVLSMRRASTLGLASGDMLKIRTSEDSKQHLEATVEAVDADFSEGADAGADAKVRVTMTTQVRLAADATDVYVVGRKIHDFKVLNQEQLCGVAIGAVNSVYLLVQELQAEVARMSEAIVRYDILASGPLPGGAAMQPVAAASASP